MNTTSPPLKNCIFQLKITFFSLFPKEANVFTLMSFWGSLCPQIRSISVTFSAGEGSASSMHAQKWDGSCWFGREMLHLPSPPCLSLRSVLPPWQPLWPLCKPSSHLPISSALFFLCSILAHG